MPRPALAMLSIPLCNSAAQSLEAKRKRLKHCLGTRASVAKHNMLFIRSYV